MEQSRPERAKALRHGTSINSLNPLNSLNSLN
nr:MAG TPA: hypothetical protein [Bacteriophage sp.]